MGTPGYLAPEVIEGRPSSAGLRRACLGRHGGLRRHRAAAVRHRLVRDDLLPDRERQAGPDRDAGAAAAAAGRRAAPGPGPAGPPAVQLRSRAAALDPAVLLPMAVPAGGLQGTGLGGPGDRGPTAAPPCPTAPGGRRGPAGPCCRRRPGATTCRRRAAGGLARRDPADRRRSAPTTSRTSCPRWPTAGRPGAGDGSRRPGRRSAGRAAGPPGLPGRGGAAGRGGAGTAGPLDAAAPAADPGPGRDGARGECQRGAAGGGHPGRAGRAGAAARPVTWPTAGRDRAGAIVTAGRRSRFFVVRSLIVRLVAGAAGAHRGRGRGRAHVRWPCPSSAGLHALSYAAGALVAFYASARGPARRAASSTGSSAAVVRSPGGPGGGAVRDVRARARRRGAAVTSPAVFWPLGTPNGTLVHLPGFQGPFGTHLRHLVGAGSSPERPFRRR